MSNAAKSSAELRQNVTDWFDSAKTVAHLLRKLDLQIATLCQFYFRFTPLPILAKNLKNLKYGSIHAVCLDDLKQTQSELEQSTHENLLQVSKLVCELEKSRTEQINDYLLFAFPVLGFFEANGQSYKSAWDRLMIGEGSLRKIWSDIRQFAEQIESYGTVEEMQNATRRKGYDTAVAISRGLFGSDDLEATKKRLTAEYTQALRDIPTTDPKQNSTAEKKTRTRKRTDPETHKNKLRQKIVTEGYIYPGSYKELVTQIGGSEGTWTNIFRDPDNTDLLDWKENRGVYARNCQAAAEKVAYEPEEYLPDEDLETQFAKQVKHLPKKEQNIAWEQFRKMEPDVRRNYIRSSRS